MTTLRSPWLKRNWPTAGMTVAAILSLATGAWLLPAIAQQVMPPKEPWYTPKTRLGITPVEVRLKGMTPAGRHIAVGHVEGGPGSYLPGPNNAPFFRGLRILGKSGNSQPNSHATWTARVLYSLAPGIPRMDCYASGHWMAEGCLHVGTAQPPVENDLRVISNSWIGGGGSEAVDALRRIDYLVDERDVIVIGAVNNGKDTPVPPLLAGGYNLIVMGSGPGNSSGGYTQFEGDGRCKPDLVAPSAKTSFTTPMAAALAARLLETADDMKKPGNKLAANHHAAQDAGRSEVIKAVLMAGAVKPRGWQPQEGKPLDEHFGAGVARFDHSYAIFTEPLPSPTAPLPDRGWDFAALAKDKPIDYTFNVDQPMGELSIVLVWNRRIAGQVVTDPTTHEPQWDNTPRLADLDLQLDRLQQGRPPQPVSTSASRIDNVEHIYRKAVVPGTYRLHLTRHDELDESWDYALAWRLEPPRRQPAPEEPEEPDEPAEPQDADAPPPTP